MFHRKTSLDLSFRALLCGSAMICAFVSPAPAQQFALPQAPLGDAKCGYNPIGVYTVPPCTVDGTRTVTDIGDAVVDTPFGPQPTDIYRVEFDGTLQVSGAVAGDDPLQPQVPLGASDFFSDNQTVNVTTSYVGEFPGWVLDLVAPGTDPAFFSNYRDFDTSVHSIDVDLQAFVPGSGDGDEDAGIGTRYSVQSINPNAIVNGNSTALQGSYSESGDAIVFGRIAGTATLITNPGVTPTPQTRFDGTPMSSFYSPFALQYDVTAQETTRLDANGLITPTISVTDGINMNGSVIRNLGAGVAPGDAVNKAQLDAETAARTTEDVRLGKALTAEANTRATADTRLTTAINTEAQTRANADLQLSQRIELEAEERAAIAQSLQSETAARIAADNATSGRLDAMSSRLDQVDGRLDRMEDYVAGSTAVAVAMTGNTFLPNTTFNLTANVGTYDGAHAGSMQFGAMVGPKTAVNAGIATGFNKRGKTAARAGVTFGW